MWPRLQGTPLYLENWLNFPWMSFMWNITAKNCPSFYDFHDKCPHASLCLFQNQYVFSWIFSIKLPWHSGLQLLRHSKKKIQSHLILCKFKNCWKFGVLWKEITLHSAISLSPRLHAAIFQNAHSLHDILSTSCRPLKNAVQSHSLLDLYVEIMFGRPGFHRTYFSEYWNIKCSQSYANIYL